MERLVIAIHEAEIDRTSGVMFESDGRLGYREVSQEYRRERHSLLERAKRAVERWCDVVPVIGPTDIPPKLASLRNALDAPTFDTLLLCAERGAVLITEDGGLRQLATHCELGEGLWLQPFLMILRDEGVLTRATYSNAILDKIERGHSFISIDAHDLFWAVLESSGGVSQRVERALRSFQKADLDLASGMSVGAQFCEFCLGLGSLSTTKRYLALVLDALCASRPRHSAGIGVHFVVALSRTVYETTFGELDHYPTAPPKSMLTWVPTTAGFRPKRLARHLRKDAEAVVGYEQAVNELVSTVVRYLQAPAATTSLDHRVDMVKA